MTDTPLSPEQLAPGAATLTDLYTVPADTQFICSKLQVCNRGAATTFRVAVRPAGAAISNEMYQYYDAAIGANEAFPVMAGVTLGAGDVISVYNTLATLSFSLYGVERA